MIITKDNPVGRDLYIDTFQKALYTALGRAWPGANYVSYPRCYRTKTDTGYVARVYTGSEAGDFQDVYWDDRYDVISFFGLGETTKDQTQMHALVHLVFFCDLAALKGRQGQYMDEEVLTDVLRPIGKVWHSFHLLGWETGVENVLREYKGSATSERLRNLDASVHAFRLNFSLVYNPFQTPLKLS